MDELETFESLGLSQWIARQMTKLGKDSFYQPYKLVEKLSEESISDLEFLGLKKPTPIQMNCIPAILQGRDCIGAAKTG